MKTNTEMNTNSDVNAAAKPVTHGTPFRRTGLKVGAVILSLMALCLSYRSATEAVALYGVLDKMQAALAHEQAVKSQTAGTARISETNHRVAGL